MNKIYVLAECIERDIYMTRFETLKEAQEEMFKCYMETIMGKHEFIQSEYAKMDFPECLKEIKKNEELYSEDGSARIASMWAYINDGNNHDNYDWKIQEL